MHHWKAALLAAALVGAPAMAQVADLNVVIADGGSSAPLSIISPFTTNGPGTFAITVGNTGPATSGTITVNATLPDNVQVAAIDPTCTGGGGFPCTLAPLANGASITLNFQLAWSAPLGADGGVALPATCPTNMDFSATVSSTTTDPTTTDNTVTITGVTVPMADLTGTASGPAGALPDGGVDGAEPLPGATVTFKGSITNNGPCALPAGALNIDASSADTATAGLTFVSGTGDCTPWVVSTPPAATDGTCTLGSSLAAGSTANFSVSQSIQPLAPKDAGGDSIIQSAVVFNYLILYGGNPAQQGDNEAPVFTTLVKGPASSCAVAGEGVTAVPFLFSAIGLALWMRRRRSR